MQITRKKQDVYLTEIYLKKTSFDLVKFKEFLLNYTIPGVKICFYKEKTEGIHLTLNDLKKLTLSQ